MQEIVHKWRKYDTRKATLNGASLQLRVLTTPVEHEKGFMFEPEPDDGFGLFFVYPEPRKLGFWMQNVSFDLDLVPLDEAGRVLGAHRLIAYDERTCRIKHPCRYVLELRAGWCERHGVKNGCKLKLINV